MGALENFTNGLMRVGAATNGSRSVADYDLRQQQIQEEQMKNQMQQSILAKLAEARNNGVTNPQSILSSLANVDPQYAEKAAAIQAQNPLAMLMQPTGGQGAQTGNQGGQNLTDLSGDDLLKALPKSIGSQVKGLATGTMPFPSGFALKTPYWQQMLQLVSQYDPSFDATNFNARSATRKDFTSGKSAQNITALNTAMGHLSSLSDAFDSLNNSDYPLYNKLSNAVGNAWGDKAIQSATTETTAKGHALAGELAKVFRSTGMAEADIKAWEDKIGTDAAPAQQDAIKKSAIELMNSRLEALGQQYNQGMGTTKNGIELLSPQAQKAYSKVMGVAPSETKVTGNLQADKATQDPISVAKSAGYTDEEIQAYLAKNGKK